MGSYSYSTSTSTCTLYLQYETCTGTAPAEDLTGGTRNGQGRPTTAAMLVDDASCFSDAVHVHGLRDGGSPTRARHTNSAPALRSGRLAPRHPRAMLNALPAQHMELMHRLASDTCQELQEGHAPSAIAPPTANTGGAGGAAAVAARFKRALQAQRQERGVSWEDALRTLLRGPPPPPPRGRAVAQFGDRSSGGALADGARARLLRRMETGASADMLKQLRMDARKPGATGISAWHRNRDAHRDANPENTGACIDGGVGGGDPAPSPPISTRTGYRVGALRPSASAPHLAGSNTPNRPGAHQAGPSSPNSPSARRAGPVRAGRVGAGPLGGGAGRGLGPLIEEELNAFSLGELAAECGGAAKAAAARFEAKHQLAARQALLFVGGKRPASAVLEQAECALFGGAIEAIRQNRLVLDESGRGRSGDPGSGSADGSWRRKSSGGGGGGGANDDGILGRVCSYLAPLFVATTEQTKAAELAQLKRVLLENRQHIASLFDHYRSQPGLAVAVAQGGMLDPPPARELAASERAAAEFPIDDAWLVRGGGAACACRRARGSGGRATAHPQSRFDHRDDDGGRSASPATAGHVTWGGTAKLRAACAMSRRAGARCVAA